MKAVLYLSNIIVNGENISLSNGYTCGYMSHDGVFSTFDHKRVDVKDNDILIAFDEVGVAFGSSSVAGLISESERFNFWEAA